MRNVLKIVKVDDNNIYYVCDCGAIGKCMIRPATNSPTIVVNVACAMCNQNDMVTLTQGCVEGSDEPDISWAYIISNEVL